MVRPISPSFLLCYIIHKLLFHSLNRADTDPLRLCNHSDEIALSQLLYDPCIFILQFLVGFLVCFLSTVLSTLGDVLLLPGVESILVVLTFLIILLIHPNRLESKATAKAVNLAFGNDCSGH